MKKVIKRKLFYNNGLSKNFFLWEVPTNTGSMYEIVEEFKGQSIMRSMLRGVYRDRLKAFDGFKKVIMAEAALNRNALAQRLAFSF